MSGIIRRNEFPSDIDVDCLVIGGGAAGLTAALAAQEAGATVLIAERETRLSGSTALSSGLIPAAGTRTQQAQQIDEQWEFTRHLFAPSGRKAREDPLRPHESHGESAGDGHGRVRT